jgi:hypothetical protein
MRILVATTYTMPGYSGGWTTPLDLFGDEHQAMYVVRNIPRAHRRIEGIRVEGVGIRGLLARPWLRGERFRVAIAERAFAMQLTRHFGEFEADFVLCLDITAGGAALRAGLPYGLRFHSKVGEENKGRLYRQVMENAIFVTTGPTTQVEGVKEIPHNQDLSRFIYREHPRAERAVLLTSIDHVHEPEVFVEGIMLSDTMRGDIVGDGPLRSSVRRMCSQTGGRVRCLSPVLRLQVPRLLTHYQIGVVTGRRIMPVLYQMKVNAYMAAGLYTIARPWTHIVAEAPELVSTFKSPGELAEELDRTSRNWSQTLRTRRRAREWVHRNYSVDVPRRLFRETLAEHFPAKMSRGAGR